jgi:hypothetical protein
MGVGIHLISRSEALQKSSLDLLADHVSFTCNDLQRVEQQLKSTGIPYAKQTFVERNVTISQCVLSCFFSGGRVMADDECVLSTGGVGFLYVGVLRSDPSGGSFLKRSETCARVKTCAMSKATQPRRLFFKDPGGSGMVEVCNCDCLPVIMQQ